MSRLAAISKSPSASECCAAVMNRSTRSAAGSGVEKSTNCSEPAGTVRTPAAKRIRAHCWTSSPSPVK
jgi:hypothetical protein